MGVEIVLNLADKLLFAATGKPLNDLQRTIVDQVWQGRKYFEIADAYGCTEGHVKDVAAELWHQLSQSLGEKVGKHSFRTAVERYLYATLPPPLAPKLHQDKPGTTVAPPAPATANDPNFVGRDAAIAAINTLVNQGHKLIVIQGEGGIGKTTLAQHYFQTQQFEVVLELLMAQEPQDIVAVDRVVEEWLRQDFDTEPGREFGVSLARLKRQLHQRPIGILIDNLEPALDAAGKFIAPHSRYVELMRVLADRRIQSVTLMTSRDRLCEPSIPTEHFRLPGLTSAAWQDFYRLRGVAIHRPTLNAMHQAYGGNAKAMGLLCGAIQTDFEGDMVAYWQEFYDHPLGVTDLNNLVISQVNRLATLDPDAHRLFYRLGCYRYQAIATLSKAALFALLWDVPSDKQRGLLTSLRNRSFVDFHKGEYWLHPVIRAAAIARLRPSPDWIITNRKAAEFWSTRVSRITQRQDALQALEAYYHYCAIADYEAAAAVLLQSRDNRWQQFLPLASSLYRMGLVQPVLEAIAAILDHLNNPQQTSELQNILGDLHWITGQIHTAIADQQHVIQTAQACLQSLADHPDNQRQHYYFRMLEVDSLLSLGLYHLDLWELDTAAQLFNDVIDLAQGTRHYRWAEKATVGLALVKAYLRETQMALTLAAEAKHTFLSAAPPAQSGRFAYFIQRLGQTYALLGETSTSVELYQTAIAFAETSHYIQVKANALKGLAEIERTQGQYQTALALHQQAIELLEDIGAKCDLADAYFQLALTYQQIGQTDAAGKAGDRAIALFTQIQAPAQLKRIQSGQHYSTTL
ncbi:MAG: tetratricopeptide repeat protein [Cyanobacteria bacterium P01_A01_bin.123]